jgi:hypothetical protein
MNFIAHLSGSRLGTFCFLLSPAVFLAVTLVQRNPPVRSPDAPVLIWDIDLTPGQGFAAVTSAQLVIRLKRAMAKPLRPVDCSIFMPLEGRIYR